MPKTKKIQKAKTFKAKIFKNTYAYKNFIIFLVVFALAGSIFGYTTFAASSCRMHYHLSKTRISKGNNTEKELLINADYTCVKKQKIVNLSVDVYKKDGNSWTKIGHGEEQAKDKKKAEIHKTIGYRLNKDSCEEFKLVSAGAAYKTNKKLTAKKSDSKKVEKCYDKDDKEDK